MQGTIIKQVFLNKMRFIKQIICSGWFASIMLMSACASQIPPEIRQTLEAAPSVAQVQNQAENYLSQRVRWGGIILQTENKHETSWLTIIALPLSDNGEPQASDQSPGRFIAIVDEFLEPLVYSQDREITVTGSLLRTETLKVGEFPYEYPVIQVDHYYLWPARPEPTDINYHPYWWYDPWHYPYYPHRRH